MNAIRPSRTRLRRWARRGLLALLVGFVLLNVVAYLHARAMMTFCASGERTPTIEKLTRLQKCKLLVTGVKLPKPVNFRTPEQAGLTARHDGILFGPGPNLDLWFVPATNARGTVALFHGYADCKASQLDAAIALHEMGFAVCLADFRGHGDSAGNETSFGYHEAEDVARVVEHLEQLKLQRPLVLFGVSMGGAAALRAVSELGVRADGLVVVSVYDRMIEAVRCRFHSMGYPSFPAAECLTFWGGVQRDMNAFKLNPADFAAGVSVPTLVMHGALDPRAPLGHGSNIFNRLAGPKSMAVFPTAAHESLIAREPDRWRREMTAFLDGLAPR